MQVRHGVLLSVCEMSAWCWEALWLAATWMDTCDIDLAKLMTWGDSHQGAVQLQLNSRLPGRRSKAHVSHKAAEKRTSNRPLFLLGILTHMKSKHSLIYILYGTNWLHLDCPGDHQTCCHSLIIYIFRHKYIKVSFCNVNLIANQFLAWRNLWRDLHIFKHTLELWVENKTKKFRKNGLLKCSEFYEKMAVFFCKMP